MTAREDNSVRRARPQCAHGSRTSNVRGGADSPVGAGGNTPVVYACARHAASIGSTSHRFEPDPAPVFPGTSRIHWRRDRGFCRYSPAAVSGIAWLLGPTGGYIWGFLFAAPLVGILALWLGQRWTIVAALAGIAVIYVPWLVPLVAVVLLGKGRAEPLDARLPQWCRTICPDRYCQGNRPPLFWCTAVRAWV